MSHLTMRRVDNPTCYRYDCILCWGDLKYDSYMGDNTANQQNAIIYFQTEAGYMKYGWTAYSCTLSAYFICQFENDDLPLFPPPGPPSPPLQPPSPPSPPAPPNCAPVYNSTFFCDATASFCYSYVTTPANFSAAAASCTSLGGYLVKYDSGHLQFDVESYLNTTGALTPYYYWIGIARQNVNGSYVYVSDGSSLPQNTSNTPYAHWSWRQPVSAAQRGFDCVIAQGQFAYDIYLGGEAAKQQTDAAYYTIDHPLYPSRKHGWNAQSCNASYPYVCQIPGASFTCYPPPSPSPPPPSPPPPPMPPAPKTGVLRRDLLCHFAGGVAVCGASVVFWLL